MDVMDYILISYDEKTKWERIKCGSHKYPEMYASICSRSPAPRSGQVNSKWPEQSATW